MKIKQKCKDGEHGAIFVEATICLPVFMFAIFTILSIAQTSLAQARMAVALDRTAKEISEYSNVYYALGLGDIFTGSGGSSSELTTKLSEYVNKVGEVLGNDTVTDFGSALAGDSITAYLTSGITTTIAKDMLKRNVLADNDPMEGDFSAFAKRYRIVEDSISMGQSRVMEGDKDVFLQLDYDIEVLRLLNLEVTFHMRHCSYAVAWAGA